MVELSEALKVVERILEDNYSELSFFEREVKGTIENAIKGNLCELIEEAVTILSSIPKEEPQELAITLTMILEGDTDGNN